MHNANVEGAVNSIFLAPARLAVLMHEQRNERQLGALKPGFRAAALVLYSAGRHARSRMKHLLLPGLSVPDSSTSPRNCIKVLAVMLAGSLRFGMMPSDGVRRASAAAGAMHPQWSQLDQSLTGVQLTLQQGSQEPLASTGQGLHGLALCT